jgi:hypothetical protein
MNFRIATAETKAKWEALLKRVEAGESQASIARELKIPSSYMSRMIVRAKKQRQYDKAIRRKK